MAASKNARKRRSKNQKKANAAARESSATISPESSPSRSNTPDLAPNASATAEPTEAKGTLDESVIEQPGSPLNELESQELESAAEAEEDEKIHLDEPQEVDSTDKNENDLLPNTESSEPKGQLGAPFEESNYASLSPQENQVSENAGSIDHFQSATASVEPLEPAKPLEPARPIEPAEPLELAEPSEAAKLDGTDSYEHETLHTEEGQSTLVSPHCTDVTKSPDGTASEHVQATDESQPMTNSENEKGEAGAPVENPIGDEDSTDDVDIENAEIATTSVVSHQRPNSEDVESQEQPEIPQRSVARIAEPENVIMLEAKRQPLAFAKPVMLRELTTTGEADNENEASGNKEGNKESGANEAEFVLHDDDDFDPDLYFDEPEDAIVVSAVKQELSSRGGETQRNWQAGPSAESDDATLELHQDHTALSPDEKLSRDEASHDQVSPQYDGSATNERQEYSSPGLENSEQRSTHAKQLSDMHFEFEDTAPVHENTNKDPENAQSFYATDVEDTSDSRILQDMSIPQPLDKDAIDLQAEDVPLSDTDPVKDTEERAKPGMIRLVNNSKALEMPFQSPDARGRSPLAERVTRDEESTPKLSPPEASSWSPDQRVQTKHSPVPRLSAFNLEEPLSSPHASPRPYKYAQSPLPDRGRRDTEPPIFGVCVVGFHHQRGPEVEYWVGPDESRSSMWPYLPFQSLPDGSHQFEENICYFTLLYDRNKNTSASLTFDRDENGHIKEGTSDFRDVTTLFAIACSRQVPLADLEHVADDEEYTRSIVQKSVVVIASKPIFGPIKEKLAMVTRSFFDQRNFSDHAIIDHLYANLVQMPLWLNENDLQVGMNLQRCIRDFGEQVLVILKAMLLEVKILFYASDTDVLGMTQFALVSLVPDLINHLEDCGSPLLSSYELSVQNPDVLKSSDRSSLLKYAGFPLQLFAGGGVLAPFVPLQQFDDLRQPETRYGMVGTTNNLFLGREIDFDIVVNVDTHEVQMRNPDVVPLLKLTDADKAFVNEIKDAVSKSWDAEDRWEPTALIYHGGEDYIRHEFEEYLIGLLASAKYYESLISTGSETASTHTSSSAQDEREASSVLQHWGKPWVEKWMSTTNNFRIFDKYSDENLFHVIEPVHPGAKLLKPTGFEKFLGLFRPKRPPPISKVSANSSPQSQSPTIPSPSALRTPIG